MNIGTAVANGLGGVSLSGVLLVAMDAGEYKAHVDTLMSEREDQKEILLEQRTLQTEQKHVNEELEDLQRQLRELLREIRQQNGGQ